MSSSEPPSKPMETDQKTTDPPSDSTSNPPTLPKAKLSAFARFKSYATSGLQSAPEPPFPPTTWDLSGSPQSGTGASDWEQKSKQYKAGLEKWREEVKALTQAEQKNKTGDSAENAEAEPDTQDAPDTRTLAMRIQALIDEKFTFPGGKSHQSAPSTPAPASSSATPTGTRSTNPSAPGTPHAGSTSSSSIFGGLDATLARLLSSEAIMNGEVGKGLEKGRESVWTMLDKLGAMAGASGNGVTVDKGKGKATDQNQTDEHPGHEEEGIMMYTPLQPTKDLEPEIADSELEYADDDEPVAAPSTETPQSKPVESTPVAEKKPAPKSAPKPKRVFYPSSTQLSLEVTWWGYRLFLPPPVIAQLSSTHIAAAKRGAMITAALKWLVDQVPIMVVPPQLRPGLMMLKRMTPFLGYIGAFVAWSWGRVQAKDLGQGVVLTATWLLPIAILPATWDYQVHGRPRDIVAVDAQKTPTQVGRAASVSAEKSAGGPSVTDSNKPPANSTSENETSNAGTAPLTNLISSAWSSLGRAASTKGKTG